MLFSLAIIATVGVIAFYHYIQGFFSATISAVLSAIAALLALSCYEPVVNMLLAGKMANFAHGIVLLMLFAVFYLVPRLAFDKMVPGNIRVPHLIDKAGGAVMGAVAGVFASGVVAIAAQALPFMPNVGGYTVYAVNDTRPVQIPAFAGRAKDGVVYDEVIGDESGRFDETQRSSMLLPADAIVVAILKQQSGGGALAGSQPLTSVHPDLLQELFGQRLGMQTGATRVIIQNPAKQKNAINGVELYQLEAIPQVDAGYEAMRTPGRKKQVPARLVPPKDQVLLVVRVALGRDAGDAKTFLMRFSPGSVRLVAGRRGPSGEMEPANYFPLGTIDGARQLVANRIDDFLIADVRQERAIDFAFLVDRDGLLAPGSASPAAPGAATAPAEAGPAKVKPGVFLEINRMAVLDLSGADVRSASAYAPKPEVEVKRVAPLVKPAAPPPVVEPVAPPPVPKPLKEKLTGTWTGKAGNGADLSLTFNADGTVAFTVNGSPGTGSWSATGEANPTTLNIVRKLGGNPEEPTTVSFTSDDSITMTTAQGVATSLTRKK
jgi:hypothetical protein